MKHQKHQKNTTSSANENRSNRTKNENIPKNMDKTFGLLLHLLQNNQLDRRTTSVEYAFIWKLFVYLYNRFVALRGKK